MVPPIRALYQQALITPSDIREHLPTLYQLARGCRHVTEFGTRTGFSTCALLYAQPEVLVCYDLARLPAVDMLEAAARQAGRPLLDFHHADVLQVEIEETDLLFIDTFHVYEQLRQELARHAGKARQYLALHDTTTYGQEGEQPGSRGLLPAIEAFLSANPHWSITTHFTNNNGLTILTRELGCVTTIEPPRPMTVPNPAGEPRPRLPQEAPPAADPFALGPDSGTAPAESRTAIVVPVHSPSPHAQRCLRSIVATSPEATLIVVDDASDSEAQQWLQHFLAEESPDVHPGSRVLLRNDRRQLLARTVNRGIRWAYNMQHAVHPANVAFIAVVDGGCSLRRHWLKGLLMGMDDPRVGLVAYPAQPDGQEPPLREHPDPDLPPTHCLLLRMSMLEEIGVLAETGENDPSNVHGADGPRQTPQEILRALARRATEAGWKNLECHCRLCSPAVPAGETPESAWLPTGALQPLWPACDRLVHPTWVEGPPESR